MRVPHKPLVGLIANPVQGSGSVGGIEEQLIRTGFMRGVQGHTGVVHAACVLVRDEVGNVPGRGHVDLEGVRDIVAVAVKTQRDEK